MSSSRATWNALIRTHHITSRKKVTRLRQAAANDNVYALLRSGGSPGIMYVQGGQEGVENWVAAVKRLRYKDFQLAAHPASMDPKDVEKELSEDAAGLFETDSVKYFASEMERRGVLDWWRKNMGFTADDRL
ncbi:unnamed protein product [Zymoseptoria tritici ST99CH_3D7]|uniref:Uncharacterized protein n=1 Tax=Zymoseptoria tritici (strain ST99CH_3D7) TaxID=1276538 RepID=A0A1X7S1B3_ZYMT9|nr:unnamed protein product [Zymoseptoria tritici ST99CH_3D7]